MVESIQSDPLLYILGLIVGSFGAGFGAAIAILKLGAHEIVKKGTWIYKSEIVGGLLKSEAIAELSSLIDIGESIDVTDKIKVETYMMRVHTFVHHLDIPKNIEWGGKKNFAELEIDRTIRG